MTQAIGTGGGLATTGDGSLTSPRGGAVVAGDVRIGNIRGYSAEVEQGAGELVRYLDGLGENGLKIITEFEHLAQHMREIANELISNANNVQGDGWDPATVSAARHQANRATAIANEAEAAAKELRELLETKRTRLRELAGQLGTAAADTITTVNDGHANLERAVRSNPVQPAPRTDQYQSR